jgi:hypothetical protein
MQDEPIALHAITGSRDSVQSKCGTASIRSSYSAEVVSLEELHSEKDGEMLTADTNEIHGIKMSEIDEGSDIESPISRSPVVLPRSRYPGTCNVETVKDGKRLFNIEVLMTDPSVS